MILSFLWFRWQVLARFSEEVAAHLLFEVSSHPCIFGHSAHREVPTILSWMRQWDCLCIADAMISSILWNVWCSEDSDKQQIVLVFHGLALLAEWHCFLTTHLNLFLASLFVLRWYYHEFVCAAIAHPACIWQLQPLLSKLHGICLVFGR
jgi:hypothetical protein